MKLFELFLSVLFFVGAIEHIAAKYLLVDIEETEEIGLKSEPRLCCKAMFAPCLACLAGMTLEEYCEGNPTTAGCAVGEPKISTTMNDTIYEKPTKVDKLTPVVEQRLCQFDPCPHNLEKVAPFIVESPKQSDGLVDVYADDVDNNEEKVALATSLESPYSTPSVCCQAKNVPAFCLGLCMPATLFTSRSEIINACTPYQPQIKDCMIQSRRKKRCRKRGSKCSKNKHCCSKRCSRKLFGKKCKWTLAKICC